ncbi:MAG: DeoR/GlpR family DNA-binding transcription regulator [Solirubrobacteraceae bacterium]
MSAEPEPSDLVGRPVLPEARRAAIAAPLRDQGAVTIAELERRFDISAMTARRDLDELERQGVAQRTHGGAVAPSVSTHEDSFARRVEIAADAKAALARAAVEMLAAGETVFLDSSTSAYYVARRIVEAGVGVTAITNSVPIMNLIATSSVPKLSLVGVGGRLRELTRSFVGPFAVQTVVGHFADRAFFSVKGITSNGVMTDPDDLEAEVKRSMLAQAERTVLLIDGSKLAVRGVCVIGRVGELSDVLAYETTPEQRERLQAPGVQLRVVGP